MSLQTDEARTADHGGALEPRRFLHSRDSGSVPGAAPSRLYHRPDHRVSQEHKKVLRRIKKIGNAHIFEALVSRHAAQRRLIDELLSLFGGQTQPVMAHLIESGKLTLDEVRQPEKTLRKLARKDKSS